jgi:hypothetical protein
MNVSSEQPTGWMVILQKTALFLVLPSTIAAIPTYRDLFTSVIKGIPLGSAASAEQSDSAFIRNVNCLKTDMKPLRNNIGAEVSAVVCRSGDVLVKITPPARLNPYINGLSTETSHLAPRLLLRIS